MKKKMLIIFIIAIHFIIAIPNFIYADTGPKPSIHINFVGLESEKYFVTLLSEGSSTGPFSHNDSNNSSLYDDADGYNNICTEFNKFIDADNYYFINFFQECTDTSEFSWTYYPPYKFKVLIYFPDKNCFVSSSIIERYAFDSYFTVYKNEFQIQKDKIYENAITYGKNTGLSYMSINKTYDFKHELLSLIFRIIITLAIEIFIAFAFKYRTKKLLKIIVLTNIITQVLLNIALNIISFYHGNLAFVFCYVLLEVLVVIIEAIVYSIFFNKHNMLVKQIKFIPILYSIVSNAASFVVGMLIAVKLSSIF